MPNIKIGCACARACARAGAYLNANGVCNTASVVAVATVGWRAARCYLVQWCPCDKPAIQTIATSTLRKDAHEQVHTSMSKMSWILCRCSSYSLEGAMQHTATTLCNSSQVAEQLYKQSEHQCRYRVTRILCPVSACSNVVNTTYVLNIVHM